MPASTVDEELSDDELEDVEALELAGVLALLPADFELEAPELDDLVELVLELPWPPSPPASASPLVLLPHPTAATTAIDPTNPRRVLLRIRPPTTCARSPVPRLITEDRAAISRSCRAR
jgi:hypothetical protein